MELSEYLVRFVCVVIRAGWSHWRAHRQDQSASA
jgi:hypothetical protein